jgi:2-polyprenyl-3-methyl-5-hydroxy-6-metoxy-1,4-benzoquinol methylase
VSASTGGSDRFAFGANWQKFLATVDEERIQAAEQSLRRFLNCENLVNQRFVDVGSGSGLFSLAARRLGATVLSFDLDTDSVQCTAALREKFFPGDERWQVRTGSILDGAFLGRLGVFDVVYSWGVLHHTGEMWKAVGNAARLAAPGARFFLAIYNDQGRLSEIWRAIKKMYNCSGRVGRFLMVCVLGILCEAAVFFYRLLSFQNPFPFAKWRELKRTRGMSPWYDLVDWVGGYPFEVAKPEEVFLFCKQLGFRLENLRTRGGKQGCNEFLFLKE